MHHFGRFDTRDWDVEHAVCLLFTERIMRWSYDGIIDIGRNKRRMIQDQFFGLWINPGLVAISKYLCRQTGFESVREQLSTPS